MRYEFLYTQRIDTFVYFALGIEDSESLILGREKIDIVLLEETVCS